jgi:O-antigen/teichoic acid export membrane protein
MHALKQQPLSKKSLSRTIGRDTTFGILASCAQIGTRLLTVPVVIQYLGLGGYGIWNTIMVTATAMRFGSIGAKAAFQKYVAEATETGDYERANKLLSTGCAAMLALSVFGLIPIIVLSPQIARWSGVPPEFATSASGAISWLALIMMMSNVGSVFEAIVMGGQRIDLARKCGTVLCVTEAIAIIIVLRLGYGLFAMAGIMGLSEFLFVVFCYRASHKVLPRIHITPKFISSSVAYELFRFAGSYQLLNMLEIVYGWLMTFVILRTFGPTASGMCAVVTRIISSATILQDALLSPILSGGTMVFSSGSTERMRTFITKAFKATLALSLVPIGFISVFGPIIAYAWTGYSDPSYGMAFFFICLQRLFGAFSLLALVLYRVSGNALLDNVRQVIRALMIVVIGMFAHRLGLNGVLAGIAATELVGMVFMICVLTRTFDGFGVKLLVPDAVKISQAVVLILGAGVLASYLPMPTALSERLSAVLKLGTVLLGCIVVAWPSLVRTGSITSAEAVELLGGVLPRRRRPATAVGP